MADPSIQRVAQNTQANQNSLENYQPFEQTTTSQNGPAVMQPSTQSTVIPSAMSDPAAVTQISTAELQVNITFKIYVIIVVKCY